MSSSHMINHRQLKMFMTPAEIKQHVDVNSGELEETYADEPDPGSGGYYNYRKETPDELWERKTDESWDNGLAQSIEQKGVSRAVDIVHGPAPYDDIDARDTSRPWLGNGYHRVAAAQDVRGSDELIPVEHHETFDPVWKKAMNEKSW